MKIIKNPGPDWVITYVDLEDGEELDMMVFGQETEEQALKEARYSLGDDENYKILRAKRLDQPDFEVENPNL